MSLSREEIKLALTLDKSKIPWSEGLLLLTHACQSLNISLSFEYHSGLYQKPGEGVDDWSEPFLDKKLQGYTLSVAQMVVTNDDGQIFWETPGEAVGAGFYLLDAYLDGDLAEEDDTQ